MSHLSTYSWRKTIPKELSKAALSALKHYPSLQMKKIVIRYTRKASSSIMKAQPDLKSVLRLGNDRSYIIYVNRTINLGDKEIMITSLPEEVLKGWFGHELGHVMDYESLSKWGLLRFGLGYLFSNKFVREAENRADRIAIKHQLGSEILSTKNFILSHAGLPEKYKRKIRKLYPSPEQIMEIIQSENSGEKLEALTK